MIASFEYTPGEFETDSGNCQPIWYDNFAPTSHPICGWLSHLGDAPYWIWTMAKPQLLVRGARACDLARRLARRENRSIADIVERALEACEIREGREPAPAFYARLSKESGTDIDLEAVIREHREIGPGPKL
jgi:hypothetical protein